MTKKLIIFLLPFLSGIILASESKEYYIDPGLKEWYEKREQAAQSQIHLIESFVARFLANKLDQILHLPTNVPKGGYLSDLQILEIEIKSYQNTPLELLPENMRNYVKARIEYLDKKERYKDMYYPEKQKNKSSYTLETDKDEEERNAAFEKKFGCPWHALESAASSKVGKAIYVAVSQKIKNEGKEKTVEYSLKQQIEALNEVSKIGLDNYFKKHPELRPSIPLSTEKEKK